jgi:AcrR family transcriptional regulator
MSEAESTLRAAARRGRKRQDPSIVRRRLIEAATTLFAESGSAAVNSNMIARRAGVGVGTFYQHFSDKREVHQAIVLDALETLRRALAANAPASGASIEEQVSGLIACVLDFALEDPPRFRVAFGAEAPPPRAATTGQAGGAPRPNVGFSTRATERRLREMRDAGQLDPALDPEIAARAFVAMQSQVVCWWLEDPSRASRESLIASLTLLHPAIAARLPN